MLLRLQVIKVPRNGDECHTAIMLLWECLHIIMCGLLDFLRKLWFRAYGVVCGVGED